MPEQGSRAPARGVAVIAVAAMVVCGCESGPLSGAPRTIEPARAASSPPAAITPAGTVLPLAGSPLAAVVDGGALVVLTGEAGAAGALAVVGGGGAARTMPLPGPATALAADGRGGVFAATRGGVFTVDLASGQTSRRAVAGARDADFTAIARRADGRLVLGSADGAAYTLTGETAGELAVAAEADVFARVDALAAVGDVAVVLDRGQTSVTALKPDGSPAQSLRAGLGATTMTADQAGRVLVADTRGGQLLVFGVDPLIERQAYPVGGAPHGIAGSGKLVWVSLTASNTVVGYDLSTGIPVEKARYPTVRQPDVLAYDDSSGTLFVVSGAGAGVQAIPDAGGRS